MTHHSPLTTYHLLLTTFQAEFFVDLQHAQAAIRAVWAAAAERAWSFSSPWGDAGPPVKGLVDAMEFRQVKGDGAWLSPQPVDSLGIHVRYYSNTYDCFTAEILLYHSLLATCHLPIATRNLQVSFNGDPAMRAEVLRALPALEEALEPFRPRHHWGKCAQLTASPVWVASFYGERLRRFRALCDVHDPTGKFRNLHVNEMLFGKLRPS